MMEHWFVPIVTSVLIATIAATFVFAYNQGRRVEREAVLTRSVEVLRERSRTDEEVRNMDDTDLCRALGGVFSNGTCK